MGCGKALCPHLLPEHPWVHKHPGTVTGASLLGKMMMDRNGTCTTGDLSSPREKLCTCSSLIIYPNRLKWETPTEFISVLQWGDCDYLSWWEVQRIIYKLLLWWLNKYYLNQWSVLLKWSQLQFSNCCLKVEIPMYTFYGTLILLHNGMHNFHSLYKLSSEHPEKTDKIRSVWYLVRLF